MFQPLRDLVLIKKIQDDEKSDGGIIFTGTNNKPGVYGTVIAIGPKQENVKVDDTILYRRGTGIESEEFGLILRNDEILATVIDAKFQ